jgi:orotate phosphoribosyltransferase
MAEPALRNADQALLDIVAERNGHFVLESGYHAATWLELDRLFTRPAELLPFVSLLANKISQRRLELVCGPLTGGAFLAQMIATQLGVDFCWAEPIRTERRGLFAVDYRIPAAIRGNIAGRRVAIVDDAISAGSAVRGTLADLDVIGARTIVLGALLVLGPAADELADRRGFPLERVVDVPFRTWLPAECPLCASSTPLER